MDSIDYLPVIWVLEVDKVTVRVSCGPTDNAKVTRPLAHSPPLGRSQKGTEGTTVP